LGSWRREIKKEEKKDEKRYEKRVKKEAMAKALLDGERNMNSPKKHGRTKSIESDIKKVDESVVKAVRKLKK